VLPLDVAEVGAPNLDATVRFGDDVDAERGAQAVTARRDREFLAAGALAGRSDAQLTRGW
jgi:hypothetical protein